MKHFLFILLLAAGHLAYGQNDINKLRLDDVVPVIMDELGKGGYDWLYDRVLFKIDSGEYVVLAGQPSLLRNNRPLL